MNGNADFDRIAQSWLQDGLTEMPDRSLQAALDEIHVTSQQRFGAARRTFNMNGNIWRVAAAVVIGLIVITGVLVFLGGRQGGVGGTPSSTAPPTTPPPASPSATPAPSTSPPAVPEFPGVSDDVAPGTYLWPAGGATPADITFTVPAGWTSRYGNPNKDRGGPGEIAIGNWIIANVYTDPCQWQGSLISPAVGPTVDDLATALVAQKGRNATAPTDVTLGGYPAKRIELSIPADLDRATCDEGVIRTWVAPDEDAAHSTTDTENLGMHSGQLNVVYIVDVNGDRLVIDTWHMPGTSAADLAELQAIVDSMIIEAPASSPSPAGASPSP